MTLSEEVRNAGKAVAGAGFPDLADQLNAALGRFIGWPYKIASGAVIDAQGTKTETFSSVVYAAPEGGDGTAPNPIPADNAAAVLDASETLDFDGLRAAYGRIAQAKRLKKAPAPRMSGPSTNVTLGIIYAHSASLPLEEFAGELERLNAATPSEQWPDMLVVSAVGAVQYAVQFPGESLSGDYLPPAEGALQNFTPPLYVVMVLRPTGNYTFNKMAAFLIAHLVIFSPGAKLPNWSLFLEGMPQTAITMTGYQYNLKGELRPVPRQFYNDRYFPPPPLRIESRKGDLLSTIQFLPWQDGGVVLLKGKLPLPGIMIFFGKKGIEKGGTVNRPPDLQISYVVPVTAQDFREMLIQFQRRSNMVVKSGEGKFIIQKFADEGSTSPFMARVFMGIIRLRDLVYSDPARREKFDKPYEFVNSSLMNARATAKDLVKAWTEHAGKVASGEIARLDGRSLRIDENIDKDLKKEVESFLNAAVRTLKQGMQNLASELQVDIGFMFKKQSAFETGIAALQAADPLLADYLRQTRAWSERLVESRNAIEHTGWTLPRVNYVQARTGIKAEEPLISGQPFTEFITFMLDRLCCFVEEFTAHCLQKKMPAEITIREIALADRLDETPERFQVTLTGGGHPAWRIAYHASPFEQT